MTWNVMIVEDDFRIANIHQEVIEQLPFCTVVQQCLTAKETLTYLQQTTHLPHIILLDIFIPDVAGLSLLEKIKKTYPYITIIIASAANDFETIQAARRIGVFDYIIKPIEQKRLQLSFHRYNDAIPTKTAYFSQPETDVIFGWGQNEAIENATDTGVSFLPKGIDSLTLEDIRRFLDQYETTTITALTLATSFGISRSTARRYLEYLVTLEVVQASLHYGQVGRPQRIYTIT